MKISNNAGYTLIEMVIVLSITSTILLFFSNSLMNNFRFIGRYQKNSPSYEKLLVLNRIQKDFERNWSINKDGDKLVMEVPFLETENRFFIRKVEYLFLTNRVLRREFGVLETSNMMNLGELFVSMDLEKQPNRLFITLIFTNTNQQADTNQILTIPNRGIK